MVVILLCFCNNLNPLKIGYNQFLSEKGNLMRTLISQVENLYFCNQPTSVYVRSALTTTLRVSSTSAIITRGSGKSCHFGQLACLSHKTFQQLSYMREKQQKDVRTKETKHKTYGWFHPGWRMTTKKWHYFFLQQNLYLTKYKYWRVTAHL